MSILAFPPRTLFRLGLLAVCAALLGCTVVLVSGPRVVGVGDTVTYVVDLNAGSLLEVDSFFVADVPAGWRLESATMSGTLDGQEITVNGLVVQSERCRFELGDLRPGFRRWHIRPPELSGTTSPDATVTLEFFVESQPAGEFKLYFVLAGAFQCGAPYVFRVNAPAPGSRFLTWRESFSDGVGGVDGLAGPTDVAVSPDGEHLYVVGGVDRKIAVFDREPATGRLTFVEAEGEGMNGDGLGPPLRVALSPDGLFLYAARSADAGDSSEIVIFARDPSTGELTFVERVLEDVHAIVVSPDGSHLYAALESIAAYSRDPVSGRLTFVGRSGIGGELVLSPDGRHLYAVAGDIYVYGRDELTGELTLLETLHTFNYVPAASADGRHLYSLSGSSLSVFERDDSTGSLTLVEERSDFSEEPIFPTPQSVVLSPSGRHVLVGSISGLTVFERQTESGSLTRIESLYPGDVPFGVIEGRRSLAWAPGDRHLYAVSLVDDAVSVFETAVLFQDGFESGTTAAWSSVTP